MTKASKCLKYLQIIASHKLFTQGDHYIIHIIYNRFFCLTIYVFIEYVNKKGNYYFLA